MAKLNPFECPFCGKIPTIYPSKKDVADGRCGNAFAEVRCVNKRCAANPVVGDGAIQSDERGSEKYKQAAVRRWNKRF